MNRAAQAKPQALTEAQREILAKVGECEGPELIRRVFHEAFPGKSYSWWARRKGHSYSLVKNVIHGYRTGGEKTEACKADLAGDLGMPEWLLFGRQADAA